MKETIDPELYYTELLELRKTIETYFANDLSYKCEYAGRAMEYFFNIPITSGINTRSEGWHAIGKAYTERGIEYVDIMQGKEGQTSQKVLIGSPDTFPWFKELEDGSEIYQKNIQNKEFIEEFKKLKKFHEMLNVCKDLPYMNIP